MRIFIPLREVECLSHTDNDMSPACLYKKCPEHPQLYECYVRHDDAVGALSYSLQASVDAGKTERKLAISHLESAIRTLQFRLDVLRGEEMMERLQKAVGVCAKKKEDDGGTSVGEKK